MFIHFQLQPFAALRRPACVSHGELGCPGVYSHEQPSSFALRDRILSAIVRIDAMPTTITETKLPDLPVRRGKVRDIYDLGDALLLVSTDRISAFDWVLPTGIPDKGRVLTQLSRFWFEFFKDVPNHMISCDVEDFNLPEGIDIEPLIGRSMLVRKTAVVPVECVVRG